MKAKGRLPKGAMNKTEQRYADLLTLWQKQGDVLWWKFEAVTLKLGPDVRYSPDFMVMLADGSIEMHETKGTFVRDDARAKFRMAAGMFPFVFRWCVWDGKQWTRTTPLPEDR